MVSAPSPAWDPYSLWVEAWPATGCPDLTPHGPCLAGLLLCLSSCHCHSQSPGLPPGALLGDPKAKAKGPRHTNKANRVIKRAACTF